MVQPCSALRPKSASSGDDHHTAKYRGEKEACPQDEQDQVLAGDSGAVALKADTNVKEVLAWVVILCKDSPPLGLYSAVGWLEHLGKLQSNNQTGVTGHLTSVGRDSSHPGGHTHAPPLLGEGWAPGLAACCWGEPTPRPDPRPRPGSSSCRFLCWLQGPATSDDREIIYSAAPHRL